MEEGQTLGKILYKKGDNILREEILTAEAGVEALGFGDVFSLLVRLFFCGSVSTP